MDAELHAMRTFLQRSRSELLRMKYELSARRFVRALKANYNPAQPRDDIGRWSLIAGLAPQNSQVNLDGILGGADLADGHHYIPRQTFNDPRYNLSQEARDLFESATTGRLNDPTSNYYDRVHREYNDAVRNAFEDYLERNGIRSDQMTREQAEQFVEETKRSTHLAIRRLNMRIWMREILHGVRRHFRGRE